MSIAVATTDRTPTGTCPKCRQIGQVVEAVRDQVTGWRCPRCGLLATSARNAARYVNRAPNPGILFDRVDAHLWNGRPVSATDWAVIAGRFAAWDGDPTYFVQLFLAEATAPEIEGRTKLDLTSDDFLVGLAAAGLSLVREAAS